MKSISTFLISGITNTPTINILERIAGGAEGVLRIPSFNNLENEADKIVDLACTAGDNVVEEQQQQQQPQQEPPRQP